MEYHRARQLFDVSKTSLQLLAHRRRSQTYFFVEKRFITSGWIMQRPELITKSERAAVAAPETLRLFSVR